MFTSSDHRMAQPAPPPPRKLYALPFFAYFAPFVPCALSLVYHFFLSRKCRNRICEKAHPTGNSFHAIDVPNRESRDRAGSATRRIWTRISSNVEELESRQSAIARPDRETPSALALSGARHQGVVDVRGRTDFSRFDPRPERPHFSNFGPPAERRLFCGAKSFL